MPPRSIWSGSLSLGLLNVPVRMYVATSDKAPRFHLLHEPDMGRVGYRKVCKAEDREVPADEIVRAFEVAPGEMVVMTDTDIEAAAGTAGHQVALVDFVPLEQVDPIFFEQTHYLGPAPGADRVYALLTAAMAESGLAAIGRYVLHGKEHLAAIRARDGVLLIMRLHFADEIRDPSELAPAPQTIPDRELELARQLIATSATNFDASKYHDEFRARVEQAVAAKRDTGSVHVPADEAPAATTSSPDILEALQRSLEQAEAPKPTRRSRARR